MAGARGGFSIIEVLVAVVIVSIAGMALMESAAQGRRAYDTALKHQKNSALVSLVALSSNSMDGSGQSDGATLLSMRYPLDNSRINDNLKMYRFTVRTEASHAWRVSDEENSTLKAVSSISEHAIERIMIETDGIKIPLYGLSGEGW